MASEHNDHNLTTAPAMDAGSVLAKYLLSVHRLENSLNESLFLRRHGIAIGEWAVLAVLYPDMQLYLNEVVRRSGVSRQRINKVLRDLASKRLVTVRQIQNGDKRRRIVLATSRARRLQQTMNIHLAELVEASVGLKLHISTLRKFVSVTRFSNRMSGVIQRQAKKEVVMHNRQDD
jgi:DNA-binding MarR family transcriptional regulator